jgi:hypothetical protein
MQRADHAQAERAFPVHDFGYLAFALQVGEQISRPQPGLLQPEANRFDGIGSRDGEMGFLVIFHEERPQIEFSIVGRRLLHQALNVGEGRFVVVFGLENFGFHGGECVQMVVASILS